jgi:hypothetical protein
MTRQLIIALTVAFVSVPGAQAQSGHVAKVLIALENVWVEALVQADKAGTLAVLTSGDLKFKTVKLSNMKVYTYGDAAIEGAVLRR